MILNTTSTFTKELPADIILENTCRQVFDACFSYVTPRKTSNPELIHISETILTDLGVTKEDTETTEFINLFSGNEILENTTPYAMCYGGHQFGHWVGQLGDAELLIYLK